MTNQPNAIVTGAAGGIGLAYAKRLLERGYRVVLADLNSDRGTELQKELGPNTLFVPCDVGDWSSQVALFKAAYDWAGHIDVFLANAGVEEDEPFYSLPENDGEPVKPSMKVLDVDLNSVVYGLRLFRHYRKKSATGEAVGKMIATNSMAGLYEFRVAPVYSAAKHGVIGLLRSASEKLRKNESITLNAISPGPVDTSISGVMKKVVPTEHFTSMNVILDALDKLLDEDITGQVVEYLPQSFYLEKIRTPITDLFKISHPVLLAGMNVAAGPKLAAAVSNAGGLGVLGGISYTPTMLREQINELKSFLIDKKAPFGVDLLLPQVGGNARKTNYDYTKGKLSELIDIIIDSGAALFVSAVGVPPKAVVDKLHSAGVLYMNMVGHPKHVKKCLDLGCDIICAQGGEGGGHTGDVPTSVLIPAVVDICKTHKSPLTGHPVPVIAAGGIHNGKLLAAALVMGASAVWVGTRFILTEEAGASEAHKEAVRTADFDDNIRTVIFTGRPLRVRKNAYIENWETNRQGEIRELTSKGVIPYEADLDKASEGEASQNDESGSSELDTLLELGQPFLMGKCAAAVTEKKTAREVVDEFVNDAAEWIQVGGKYIVKL
ncbi:hypothetical protein G7Z17_g4528 [Cylindrodendrum hubeiense]|uniref:Uncharacterized protein n=1 Tax=Cylindrodendrum hubeiense TaxID=595255 RepID=A0A9P5HDN0_9HYPO|nr:hypothetical protein G7Z17_g4528 [Cylindrodendrum hubeiense]